MTAAAEVMQEAEQRAAGIVRRHYHSTYPPSTVVFTRSSELEDILSALEVPYRQTETLIMVELQDLAEKLPQLSEWLEQERQEAEQRVQKLKLKTSTRSKGYSNKNDERGYSKGGGVVLFTTYSFRDIIREFVSDENFLKLLEHSRRPRMVTSIRVDPHLWSEFKTFCQEHGLSVSYVIEVLLGVFLSHAKKK